ncbi:hypothetical protein DV453_001192 [Geotrichum candidum]|nr:hypothetical protein DV453_001192 [Geotrichum candidum]
MSAAPSSSLEPIAYEGAKPTSGDDYTFFFDIDNYIHGMMQKLIHKYFVTHLQLDDESAEYLHQQYYRDYGLAIEGLVRFHNIDAMEYNHEVDDALPLEDVLKPDPELRAMLLKLKASPRIKKLWLFTNAYKTHGLRVVKLLGIDDIFDGITYCNYAKRPMLCKPMDDMFAIARREAGNVPVEDCLYVDDSYINIKAAHRLGWHTSIHYVDPADPVPEKPAGTHVIRDILDIERVLPELFEAAPQKHQ